MTSTRINGDLHRAFALCYPAKLRTRCPDLHLRRASTRAGGRKPLINYAKNPKDAYNYRESEREGRVLQEQDGEAESKEERAREDTGKRERERERTGVRRETGDSHDGRTEI